MAVGDLSKKFTSFKINFRKRLDRPGRFVSCVLSHGIHGKSNNDKQTQRNIIMKSILKLALLGILAAGMAAPMQLRAQDADMPAAEKKQASTKKTPPVHGKLKAVDSAAQTITVGSQTIRITPETQISKGGQPATLADGAVGEEVTVTFKPTEDGKTAAVKVRFGPKEGKAGKEKPQDNK
jgi:ribosomal protein S1